MRGSRSPLTFWADLPIAPAASESSSTNGDASASAGVSSHRSVHGRLSTVTSSVLSLSSGEMSSKTSAEGSDASSSVRRFDFRLLRSPRALAFDTASSLLERWRIEIKAMFLRCLAMCLSSSLLKLKCLLEDSPLSDGTDVETSPGPWSSENLVARKGVDPGMVVFPSEALGVNPRMSLGTRGVMTSGLRFAAINLLSRPGTQLHSGQTWESLGAERMFWDSTVGICSSLKVPECAVRRCWASSWSWRKYSGSA